jgi:hypothetical protein
VTEGSDLDVPGPELSHSLLPSPLRLALTLAPSDLPCKEESWLEIVVVLGALWQENVQ